MALLHSFESSGNFLFKYRGQLPVFLFVLAVPAIYFTPYNSLSNETLKIVKLLAIGLSVLGFLFRAYAIGTTPKGTSGRNTKEQVANVLNSTGVYSIVRHPLYLGNYFMWIGIVVFVANFSFFVICSLLFWLYYERIMFAEERFLEKKFGQEYLDWSLKAPAFIPAFGKFIPSTTSFSLKTVLRREYSGVLATVISFIFVELLRNYFMYHQFILGQKYLIVLVITALTALILRSLKHYTKVLREDETLRD
jgi:protein-S-isoprenylcysteine O-methyltransferase Ste14